MERKLKFIVTGQVIQKDPTCDFSNIVPGSSGYLTAHFTFSAEWEGCVKAASFWAAGDEHAELLTDDACTIPAAALVGRKFEVSVTGAGPGSYYIPTGRATVRQEG